MFWFLHGAGGESVKGGGEEMLSSIIKQLITFKEKLLQFKLTLAKHIFYNKNSQI